MALRIGGDTARGHQRRKLEVNSTEVTADRHDLAVLARTCTGKHNVSTFNKFRDKVRVEGDDGSTEEILPFKPGSTAEMQWRKCQ